MLGIGGLIIVPFTQRYGRLPVLWWAMFMSVWMTLFATLAPNNVSFIVARCLQGLFTAAPQCVGLSFIHDMYFVPLFLLIIGSSSTSIHVKLVYGHWRSSSHHTLVHFSQQSSQITNHGALLFGSIS